MSPKTPCGVDIQGDIAANLTQRRANAHKKLIFHETQEISNEKTSTNNPRPKGAVRLSIKAKNLLVAIVELEVMIFVGQRASRGFEFGERTPSLDGRQCLRAPKVWA